MTITFFISLFFLRVLCKQAQDNYRTPHTSVQPFPPYNAEIASIYRYRQQQSVNLGSWFVSEQWMVPSIFQCAAAPQNSEIDIATGGCDPQGILERHWDTFITRQDFFNLSSLGINTVRLPIGYWSLGPAFLQNTPFNDVASVYKNAWPQVVRAINMAAEAGIGVLVDVHGAVGSQNGQPHSGISDGKTNLFSQNSCCVSNVVGVQLLNEPENCEELTDFCNACTVPDFPLYMHDGFDFDRFITYISAQSPDFIVQDHHSYFVYTPKDNAEPARNHTDDVQTTVAAQLASSNVSLPHNLIIGEWSCALTPDSLKDEMDPQQARRAFCMAQEDVYSQTTPGNSFWSYKKEDCDPDWCFLNAVGNSLPSEFFPYGSPVSPAQKILISSHKPQSLISPSISGLSRYHHRSQTIAQHRSSNMSSETRSYQEGYKEGSVTAQKFAAHGDKLGFMGQYMLTGVEGRSMSLNGEVEGDPYRQGFMQGLRDMEREISILLRLNI
ncbi:glycoside hydrolase superfamily [Rhodocollybia butyracea]|uniref:Glycoside hydrolase superfamily n=1 Tax=Rhodocollybia butyracea TaxID=206335 RepID=A0A9P5PPQ8_9AGAR|nr:glycoside hydrolase superfamily [Rhodocollybia butyracea]